MTASTPQPGKGASFTQSKRIGQARVKEIIIVDKFDKGYRNREDITNLPPGILVVGSQNIIVNTSSRVQVREGYVLDGAISTINAGIVSSFDWQSKANGERHLRAGFLTSAGNNGKLQFRYQNGATVTWTDLLTSLTSVSYNFTTFWNTTELVREVAFVNGTSNIYVWNGAYDTVASITSTTIVMNNTIATSGFYNATPAKQIITIRGVNYTYTGTSGSTFTGVTPNPTAQGGNTPVAGDLAFQTVFTYANSSFTGTGAPTATFKNNLISTLLNQIYLGSLTSPTFYVSQINSITNWDFGSPRLPGQGMTATLDDNIVAFIPQEDNMYITAGKDFWYNTKLTQGTSYNGVTATSLTTETFEVKLLKTNSRQAAQSQALTNKTGNNVFVVTNEPTLDMLGRVDQIFGTPQTSNISDPIKLDFDTYNFTGGSVFSWKRFLLVAIPSTGIVRIYNLFTKAWEAPQTLPITNFYTVQGELYGHSSLTSESYQLFVGQADRVYPTFTGQPISAIVNFSFQNYGTRTALKSGNEFYIEGYINSNTTLTGEINYELDGCQTTQSFTVSGSDNQIVCIPADNSSLGKEPFGKQKFGGSSQGNLTGLPPKFRVIKTFPRINFYEHQFSFSITGTGQRFELLAFGTNSSPADDTNFAIKQ